MNFNTIIDYTQPNNFQSNPEIIINGNGAQLVPINGVYPQYAEIVPVMNVNTIATYGLISFIPNAQIPSGTNVDIAIIRANGSWYYDGTEWINSPGSTCPVQSLTPDVLAKLDLSAGEVIQIGVWMWSNGVETPSLISLEITAKQFLPNNDVLNICAVYGYVFDSIGKPQSGVNVVAVIATAENYGSDSLIIPNPISSETNAMGYWELDLISLEVPYLFTFSIENFTKSVNARVPVLQSSPFNSLIVQ